MQITKEQRNEIYDLLFEGKKIFLDKECTHEKIRHTYYYIDTGEDLLIFYHVKSSLTDTGKSSIKDFPPIKLVSSETDDDKLNDIAEKIINEIVKYVETDNYDISCNR